MKVLDALPDPSMRLAYSVEEITNILPLSRPTIYKLISNGGLPGRRLGHRTVVLHDDLVTFLHNLPFYEAE